MKITIKILTLLLGLATVSGCMTSGEQLDSSAIDQLHRGQTKKEVRQIFGNPAESLAGANGNNLDVYQVVFPRKTTGGFRTVEVRSLHVLYDAQELVDKYYSHIGKMNGYVSRDGKWKAGRPFSAEKIQSIQRRLTTRDELIETFGQAAIEGLDVSGDRGARWYFMEGKTPSGGHRNELSVIFDSNLVVRDYLLRNLND